MLGMLLIGVAIAAVPSGMIVESFVGGSAVHGHVEDGHYFVNPGHGRPIVEVSATTWRTVYWVERLWPFSILVPGLDGDVPDVVREGAAREVAATSAQRIAAVGARVVSG